MTPSEYIDKAIHAINTDQPNLAMLYMQRGMVETDRIRRERKMQSVMGQLSLIADAFADLGRAITEQVAPVFKVFAAAFSGWEEEMDNRFWMQVSE
jgi:hypothetical protein